MGCHLVTWVSYSEPLSPHLYDDHYAIYCVYIMGTRDW